MSTVSIFDNYLDSDSFSLIQKLFKDGNFPWYRCFILSGKESIPSGNVNLQFSHFFYKDFAPSSNFFSNLGPLLAKVNPSSLVRVKANLKTPSNMPLTEGFHRDKEGNSCNDMRVGIFYVVDSDGGTVFRSGQIVDCKANRYIEFSNSLEHSGMSHTFPHDRVVVNLNFFR